MKPFVVELDDRAVSLARDGRVLASAPSAVFDGSAGEAAGTHAWHALRRHPTATSTRHFGSVLSQGTPSDRAFALVAAELTRRFAGHSPATDEHVWIVAPARVDARGLGTVLGIARSLSLPVDGFIDAASAAVAALGLERSTIVLELGLHHTAATAVDGYAGQARRRRAVFGERGGLIELYQAWIDFISTTVVRRTRFDPLHDADTEQQLFDSLPALARDVSATGSVIATLSKGTDRVEVALSRDQFAQAGQSLYREVVHLFHELRPAGAPVALVMPRFVAQLPGLREEVEEFVGCELIGVPDGFAAAATSLLDLPERGARDPVNLLRRLPLHTQATLADTVSRETLGRRRAGGSPPSHVLLDGQAYSLATDSIVVGRSPGASKSITLPDGLAGVSRRHCTFLKDGGELVLLDHSTFGTFVNGERVAERVRVHAGDRVRLGDPGVELALIAVGEVGS